MAARAASAERSTDEALVAAADLTALGRIATTGGTGPGGVPYGAALLCLGARWLTDNTGLRRYVAYCRTALVPLYQAVGAVDLEVRFRLPGRGDALYAVVAGDLATPSVLATGIAGPALVGAGSGRNAGRESE